jgi:cytochrome P450
VEQPDLIPHAVEELLRWESPTPLIPRVSGSEPRSFLDTELPAGIPVLFGIGAANRDPEVFQDPDRFDLNRSSVRILTFGPGLRTCPGMYLARKELRIALEILIERCPCLRIENPEQSRPVGTILRGPTILQCRIPSRRIV